MPGTRPQRRAYFPGRQSCGPWQQPQEPSSKGPIIIERIIGATIIIGIDTLIGATIIIGIDTLIGAITIIGIDTLIGAVTIIGVDTIIGVPITAATIITTGTHIIGNAKIRAGVKRPACAAGFRSITHH
jgi:hypothetical protein